MWRLIWHCNAQTRHFRHFSEPRDQQVLQYFQNWKMSTFNWGHLTKVAVFYFYGIDYVHSILHGECPIIILQKKNCMLLHMSLYLRNLKSLVKSSNSFIMTLEKLCHFKRCAFQLRSPVLTIYISNVIGSVHILCVILNTKDNTIDSTEITEST